MKANIEKTEGLARTINVVIPSEEVKKSFEETYNYIKNSVSLKGFRKGKVPITKIKEMYGDRAHQDVSQHLIQRGFTFALQEHKLEPIGSPDVKFGGELKEDNDFTFTLEFEVKPEVNLKKYEGLEVEKEIFNVSEDQITEVIANIQKSNAVEVPILEDRTAQSGDVADINFFGTINGTPLEQGAADNFKLELGSDSFIPGFEEGVIGMKPGVEINLSLKFPDDYGQANLAGQPVDFKVKLNKLFKKELPEINDDLAKKVGDFVSIQELKDAIKKDIEAREESRIEEDVNSRIMEALVAENPVEVPQKIKASQKEQLIQDSKMKMQREGMSEKDFEEYKNKWDSEFESSAEFMIQSTFLVSEIAKKHDINTPKKEVDDRINMHAMQMNLPVENLMKFYGEGDRRANLRFQLNQEKVVRFLKSKATIKDVEKDDLTENKQEKN